MAQQLQTIYDELLVLRYQAGEDAALNLIVQRWQLPLTKFAQVVCKRPDIAGDAVQETWLAIVHGIDQLADASRFKQWMFRILHRKCIDQLRRKPATIEPDEVAGSRVAETQFEHHDEIQYCLAQLSDAHRTVLALHYLEDMEVEEIAQIVSVPSGTVKSRLHHARNEFRKALALTAENLSKQDIR